MNTFEQTFLKNQYNIKDAAAKSRSWFQQQALLLGKQQIAPQRLISAAPELNTMKIQPGHLYLFQYDAKTQDNLPHWDMFPLVFPFAKAEGGFIGLNMHYLPYQMRVRLLDRLMEFKSNKTLNENTRLKYSWNMIAGVSRFKLAQPCVHRYLMNHVQSPFKRIEAPDWTTAMMLPVERFVGAQKQAIWANTIK